MSISLETWILKDENGDVLREESLRAVFPIGESVSVDVIEFSRYLKARREIAQLKSDYQLMVASFEELTLLNKKLTDEVQELKNNSKF